jgi:cephalosporin-C deacetylase-like acetyl esterase
MWKCSHTRFDLSINVFIVITFMLNTISYAQNEQFPVLDRWLKYSDKENVLYHHLSDQAMKFLKKRSLEMSKLSTQEQWKEKQKNIKEKLMTSVGPFPPKTPLNAQTVETIKKNGFTIEKVIFESQPKFYITACLFIPEKIEDKAPAIIYCSGHSDIAFRYVTYQRVILNLVKKGFIVLAFDPIGQGERLQYYDPDLGESKIGGPTLEHSYPGAQCFLIASSLAQYMIWDGIRVVDYLLSRHEVDGNRIGITGRSGGGTQSAYIAAFDDRILATAPECYITSFTRQLETIGPQDAEQNFYHGLANGIDHADLLEVRAPKPALMITTTRDFFSIQGGRETLQELKKIYRAFGKENNIQQIEDNDVHASTRKNRELTYAFFQKFLNLPGKSNDEDVEYLSWEELKITATGQVFNSLGGETVFSLNAAEAEPLLKMVKTSRKDSENHKKNVVQMSRKLSGYVEPENEIAPVFTGSYDREGYTLQEYFIQGEGDYPIPFLVMRPNGEGPFPVVIYLHPENKEQEINPQGEMEWFVKKGNLVIAPDLIGLGEVGPGKFKGDAYNFKPGKASYNHWFFSIQIARSLVGIRAGDVIRCLNYIKTRKDVDTGKIYALAKGEICPVLSHAAVFDQTISKIALIEPLVSYRALLMNQYYKPKYMLHTVAGGLTAYDLPDLYAALAPRDLLLVNVVNQIDQRLTTSQLKSEFKYVKSAFISSRVEGKFSTRQWESYQSMDEIFSDWLNSQ